MTKKLVCRGLGSDNWVEANHLGPSEYESMVNIFILSDILRDEGVTMIETQDASGGTYQYRMDTHTTAERNALPKTEDD